MSALITRVVKGPHDFDYVNPETGQRESVAPGEEVQVTREAAIAFKDCLIDPQVLAAQQTADEALVEAEEELKVANEEEKPVSTAEAASKPEAPKSPQRSTGPLKAARPGPGKASQ